jgi:vanillate/3-O-methylgallate O-demethylase
MTQQSLQQFLDGVPDLADYFYNDTTAPHFSRASSSAAVFIPPAFTNWRDEQRAWKKTAANFTPDRAKQFIACNRSGQVIGDCIAYRHGEESFELVSGMPVLNWVHFHAETGGYDVTVERDNHSTANPTGRRVKWRFQLDGPNAGKIFSKVVDVEPPTIGFFRTTKVTIRGREVVVLRHGMAGHQGVELSGPYDDHDVIREALLEAGEEFGIVPVGTAAYFSTPFITAWMAYPLPAIYSDDDLRAYREWLPADSWEASTQIGGSFRSSNLEDYYATPYDLGYGHIVKFDHDFIGREALEALPAESRRKRMTLVWNRDDVQKVMGSQFGDGPRYKAIDFPVAYYGFHHYDQVKDAAGTPVGVSCHSGYSGNDGEMLSLAMLAPEHAEPGTELVLTWGEPDGGSRKPHVEKHEQTQIRAVVASAPYGDAVKVMKRGSIGEK